jgi:hypothetical protein
MNASFVLTEWEEVEKVHEMMRGIPFIKEEAK